MANIDSILNDDYLAIEFTSVTLKDDGFIYIEFLTNEGFKVVTRGNFSRMGFIHILNTLGYSRNSPIDIDIAFEFLKEFLGTKWLCKMYIHDEGDVRLIETTFRKPWNDKNPLPS